MTVFQPSHNQTFDRYGNLLSEEIVQVDVTEEAVTYDLHDKVRLAIDANKAWLNRAGAPSNAEVLQHLDRVTRQLVAIEKLLIGSDLLLDADGT